MEARGVERLGAKFLDECLNGDVFDYPRFDPVAPRLATRSDNLDFRVRDLWRARVRVDHDPDRVRRLCGQPVNLERAQQADDRMRYALRDFGEGVELGDPCIDETVEPAADFARAVPCAQDGKVPRVDLAESVLLRGERRGRAIR